MSTVAPSLRLAAALAAGAHLVSRPRGVVHLADGATPLTPSGAALRSGGRTVCRSRTGRLYVFTPGVSGVQSSGRRFCRRCMVLLVPSLGRAVHDLVSRDDWLTAYGHLTAEDLTIAAGWCRTVEETHQVSRVALMVLGPAPVRRPTDAAAGASTVVGRWGLEQTLITRRRALAARERTPEEQAVIDAQREADVFNSARIQAQRAKDAVRDRVVDRANRGGYLLAHERELLHSA